MIKIPSLEEMLSAGMHFGHTKGRWHPKMKSYIFAERKGVYIIDLEKTRDMMKIAFEFIENLIKEGKTLLFVGTKNQVKRPMKELAVAVNMPYVTEKWLGGTLTNFQIFKKMIKRLKDLNEEKKLGKLDRYTKKERLELDREMGKLNIRVGGLTNLNKLPDALFIWDIRKEKTAVVEARKKNIPVIAICDTNVNPDPVNYIIPGNDDATKTISLIINALKETILSVEKGSNSNSGKDDTKNGIVDNAKKTETSK